MKTLMVEYDFTGRLFRQELLKSYSPSHIDINGKDAVYVAHATLEAGEPFNLIYLDIIEMDGQQVLKEIRNPTH